MNNLTIPEKERERLAEICKAITPKCEMHECLNCPYNDKEYPSCKGELIADSLLEKGIMTPPCQVGDNLYVLDYGEVVPVYVTRIRYNTENKDEYIRKDNLESRCQIFAFNDSGKAYEIYPKFFGLITFYEREEAEKMLEEYKEHFVGEIFRLILAEKIEEKIKEQNKGECYGKQN